MPFLRRIAILLLDDKNQPKYTKSNHPLSDSNIILKIDDKIVKDNISFKYRRLESEEKIGYYLLSENLNIMLDNDTKVLQTLPIPSSTFYHDDKNYDHVSQYIEEFFDLKVGPSITYDDTFSICTLLSLDENIFRSIDLYITYYVSNNAPSETPKFIF